MLSTSFGFIPTTADFVFRKQEFSALCVDFAEGVVDGPYHHVLLRTSVPIHESQVERYLGRCGVCVQQVYRNGVICKHNALATERRKFYAKILAGRDAMIRYHERGGEPTTYWFFNRARPRTFPPDCFEFRQSLI